MQSQEPADAEAEECTPPRRLRPVSRGRPPAPTREPRGLSRCTAELLCDISPRQTRLPAHSFIALDLSKYRSRSSQPRCLHSLERAGQLTPMTLIYHRVRVCGRRPQDARTVTRYATRCGFLLFRSRRPGADLEGRRRRGGCRWTIAGSRRMGRVENRSIGGRGLRWRKIIASGEMEYLVV